MSENQECKCLITLQTNGYSRIWRLKSCMQSPIQVNDWTQLCWGKWQWLLNPGRSVLHVVICQCKNHLCLHKRGCIQPFTCISGCTWHMQPPGCWKTMMILSFNTLLLVSINVHEVQGLERKSSSGKTSQTSLLWPLLGWVHNTAGPACRVWEGTAVHLFKWACCTWGKCRGKAPTLFWEPQP